MIIRNGIEFRNLVEQVLKNKDDIKTINDINRSLADYGIKIIGFYNTIDSAKEDLGDPYDGPYGNAVGIGSAAPYNFYIWTRANNISDVDYWQDVGTLAVVGPAGPIGQQGPQGEPGQPAEIYTGTNLPTVSGTENDIYLCVGGANNLIGNVYKIKDGTWQLQGNIRGPVGPQGQTGQTGQTGPQGERGQIGPKGDPGGFIKIAGILDTSAQLPSPTTLQDLEVAYLIGENKELWMQVGTDYDTAIWTNLGPLNVATYVSVNGQYQNIWDADTKVDKYNHQGENFILVYGMNTDGADNMYAAGGSELGAGALAMYDGDDCLTQDNLPRLQNHVVNKDYIDTYVQDSDTITTETYHDDETDRDNLKLHLNANVVADIGRSIKTPIENPASNSFVRVKTDGSYDLIATTSYVSNTYQAKYQAKASQWVPTASVGAEYDLYPASNSDSFTIVYKNTEDTQAQLKNITYANIYYIGKTRLYLQAYNNATPVYMGIAKSIVAVTTCTATLQRHAAGTNI